MIPMCIASQDSYVTFAPNSSNEIMFYAEKNGKYQTLFRTIKVQEEEKKENQRVLLCQNPGEPETFRA